MAILALVTLVAWGIASPVGASPDDDFHLASIWCGAGIRAGLCEAAAQSDERIVPKALESQAICYVGHPERSAACQGASYGTHPTSVEATSRGNFDGTYPPVFYAVMSIFAGPNVEISVLLMRVANSVLFVGLATALFLLLPHRRRPLLVGALAISLVPLGMFLIPSTNPSSWAILSACIVWLSLLGYFETAGRRKIGLAMLAVVGTVMGAGARADSAVYVGIAAACALVLTFRMRRRYLLSAILPVGLAIAAFVFYTASGQALASSSGLPGSDGTHDAIGFHLGLALSNLVNVPGLWVGVFGSWSLGWFDTKLPDAVWVGGFASFIAITIVGLRSRFRRKGIAVLIVSAALLLFPTAILAASGAAAGSYVQPRYLLPLIVIFAGVALVNGRIGDLTFSRTHLWVVAAILSISNSLSLYATIRRYVTGTDGRNLSLDSDVQWWWSIPISPMVLWAIGSLTFAAALALIARSADRAISSSDALLRASIPEVPTFR
ncbi:MAG: hypothetical protein JWO18_1394 [Microbacteriaceae bacterium]|nr:hypothetical protein [Microbacteriaceae bacterium]